ncbi:hypothetical protein QE152_g30391 [Popillia japonica]|uniref:Uncharacterized protein n=1 Tax=Popillia japonica TaxID=7064 RepID=A0AAW1JEW9_POPJA
MILKARINRPFQFKTMTYQDIIDYKNWWPLYYKKTCKANETNNKVLFSVSKYRHFIYDVPTPGQVIAGEFIDGAFFSTFRLLKPNISPKLPNVKLYSEPVPINENKIKNPKKILQYITAEDLEFWYHIVSWKTTSCQTSE